MPSRTLRVLLVSQPTTEGVARVVASLAQGAVEAGHDVTVASPSRGDLAPAVHATAARHVAIEMRRAPAPSDVRAAASIRRLAARADVIHLHSSKAGALGRVANGGLRVGRIWLFSPHAWSFTMQSPLAPIYRIVEKTLSRRCDAIVAVSDDEALAAEQLGTGARIEMIANGVDTVHFVPPTRGSRRETGPAALVVCVGRLSNQKGQDLAIRSLSCPGMEHAVLRLVGDGPRDDLHRLALSIGVASRVEFTGGVEDPRPHLRAADVIIVPSRWDGLSLALLEAMACGCAIVATKVGGANALQGCGILVDALDPAALAAGVVSLLRNPAERTELGAAARARTLQRFDLGSSVGSTIRLWENLFRDVALTKRA